MTILNFQLKFQLLAILAGVDFHILVLQHPSLKAILERAYVVSTYHDG